MIAALRTEYRKIVTTRLWWVLLICMAVYMGFLGAVMAFVLGQDTGGAMIGLGGDAPAPVLAQIDIALTVYTLAAALGYVFPVMVGALSVTNEFRHMTITPTLLAEPRRSLVLGSKLLASLPVGLVFGIVGTLASALAGAAVFALQGDSAFLGDTEVLLALGRCVLALTVWAMVGVGFGAAMPNQVAAIVTLLAFTQFVEPILRMLLAVWEPTEGVAKFLPGAAGEAIAGASLYSSSGIGDLLPLWQGLLVLIGYGLLLALVGRFTALRKDIT